MTSTTNSRYKCLARWLVLGAVGVFVTLGTIHLRYIARYLDLAASLPDRAHRLYDDKKQRINSFVKPGENSELFLIRHLTGVNSLPTIEDASLSGRRGRNALKSMSQLSQLKELTLEYVTINETVITDLETLPKLRKLNLVCCTIRDDDLRAIRQRLPFCTVQTEFDGQSLTAEQRRIAELELRAAK